MAISDGEQELFDQAQAMLAEQTVFTDERILFGYAPNEMERLLHAADLEDEFTNLKEVIDTVSGMLSDYSSSNNPFSSTDELILEIMHVCNQREALTGFTTHIASDGSFAFEGQYYTTQYPLNTVAIGYSSEYGLAPVAKEKTSYIYTEYFLTADDLPVLTADNATFKGWMLDGVTVDEGIAVSGDVTLVADWEVTNVDYTINYQTAHSTAPTSKTVTVNEGESYALTADDLPILSADGYIFGGWAINGEIISAGQAISADTVLTAVWVEDSPVSKIDPVSLMQGFFIGQAIRRMRGQKKPVAGLYETGTDNLIYSWDQLLGDEILEGGVVHVTDGVLTGNYDADTNTNSSADILAGDLVLPYEVTNVGERAFIYCEAINNVFIPSSVTVIERLAFWDCLSLKIVNVPESVTVIGSRAFGYCTNLTAVNIPDGIAEISYGTFHECSSLTSIDIPESVTVIGSDAFRFCRTLERITIPKKVTVIPSNMCQECIALKHITIPGGVTEIRSVAFFDCTSLEEIVFDGTMEQWNAITFGFDWNTNIPATEVVCRDGTVSLENT